MPSDTGGERLETCAHCGSTETPDVQIGHQGSVDEPYYYVTCEPCDASVGWSKNRAEAIAAWNRRTPSQSPDGYEVQWRP